MKRVTPLLVTGALVLGSASVAGATADVAERRLAGDNRYLTSQVVALDTFEDADVVLLANGEKFPDALSASYLAGAIDAPILLTEAMQLSAGIIDTLNSLNANGVQIIGGTASISEAIVDELEAAGFTVDRLGGENRYDTAADIALLLPQEAIGQYGAGRAAILATGDRFADALAASPLSYWQGLPLLLNTGASLRPETANALAELDIAQVLVVGGSGAIPATVVEELEGMGISVDRLFGANRQGTAVRIAEVAVDALNFPIEEIELVRGDQFADALAAGPRGGFNGAPILLTEGSALGSTTTSFIAQHSATIATVAVIGGVGAVPEAVADQAVAAARG